MIGLDLITEMLNRFDILYYPIYNNQIDDVFL